MNKYDCPLCGTELKPAEQEKNCLQNYTCPECGFNKLYDSLPLENWEKGNETGR